jgi:hypothetical protein
MSYKIGFDGIATAELDRLLQSIEKRVNGSGIHAQTSTSDTGASMATSGSTTPDCPPGKICPDSVKGGHDAVVIVIAIVGGAVAGYAAGKLGAKRVLESVKGGHD